MLRENYRLRPDKSVCAILSFKEYRGILTGWNPDDRRKLAGSMRQFIRMYNPHEAREDTVLFPAFRGIVSAHEFDSLGEDFEKKEDELFGDDGFEKMVDKVAEIEKKLGIYDLAQFTPKV